MILVLPPSSTEVLNQVSQPGFSEPFCIPGVILAHLYSRDSCMITFFSQVTTKTEIQIPPGVMDIGTAKTSHSLDNVNYAKPYHSIFFHLLTKLTPAFVFSQISSVAQSCPTLCNPVTCRMPGLPVHHQLPEFTQTHFHRVSDAIQPSHPLLSPAPPAPSPSQHQSLFQGVNSSHEVAKVLEFQLQHHSFQRNPRADLHSYLSSK